MSFWDISKRGFLPVEDPRPFLTNRSLATIVPAYQLEILVHSLLRYKREGVLVSAIKEKLGDIVKWNDLLETHVLGDLERLQLLLSLLAQVTFLSCQEKLIEIDIPLRAVNHVLGYQLHFYYLVNWARRFPNSMVNFDGVKPLHLEFGRSCEITAIQLHVALEAIAASSIRRIDELAADISLQKEPLETALRAFIETLTLMTVLAEDREWAFSSSSLAKYAFDALIEPRTRISLCRSLTGVLPTEHNEFFRRLAKSGLRLDTLARKYGLMFLFRDLEHQYRLFCSAYNK